VFVDTIGLDRMKLASFLVGGVPSYGIVGESGLIDLKRRLGFADLKAALEHLDRLDPSLAAAEVDYAYADVRFEVPINNPTHIIGIGLNTKSHFEETATLMSRKPGDYPRFPRLFQRSPLSVVGHGEAIFVPRASEQLDYEGEIALIIGKPGRYVSEAAALDHVAGFSLANEGSVRDFQMHSNQVTAGKNFYASGSIGPWIATRQSIVDISSLTFSTRVNGELRQRLTMDDLIFSFSKLISYISTIFFLQPGDIILTGSPEGIGALRQVWLRPGDIVEIDSPQIGTLRNTVKAEE
jgi:2-keto-4-pentenoate hydratase/2-oxohepta-3-ene-1,7-dioic acid hydratase in catechol pathway